MLDLESTFNKYLYNSIIRKPQSDVRLLLHPESLEYEASIGTRQSFELFQCVSIMLLRLIFSIQYGFMELNFFLMLD